MYNHTIVVEDDNVRGVGRQSHWESTGVNSQTRSEHLCSFHVVVVNDGDGDLN